MMYKQIYGNIAIWIGLFFMPMSALPDKNIANKYFLEKQKFLFEIVHNLQEPLWNEEWNHVGKTLVMDKTCYLNFNSFMENYLYKINSSTLLGVNEIFVLTDRTHLEELKGLYYFLYNAQDFETLQQNICWARTHVQAQMFLFALTQVLMKREDLKDLNLPKIYEIWPQHFFADKHVKYLQHFNYVQWSKNDLYQEYFREPNISKNLICKAGQWWCKENLEYKIYKEKEKIILPKTIYGDYRNSSKWLLALEDVSLFWLPVAFSSELTDKREFPERTLSYLIEDKSWNAYWYYINMGLWLNEHGENELYTKPLRDWWFWNLQQIVIRYKMEASSTASKLGLDPFLINYQGLKYRPIEGKASQSISNFINDLFVKTQNAINEQTYELKNKTTLKLYNPEHLEFFLEENFAIEKVLKAFMSIGNDRRNPSVFQYFETMLRSKEFYYYAENIIKLYVELKANFEPCKPRDFESADVTFIDVEITELKTYFEIIDTDVTNLLRSSNFYFEGNFLWFKSVLAKQQNLQHQPFKFVFNITSDKQQAILVRTFLTRDCSALTQGECYAPLEMFQLDTFVSSLAIGCNIIERESKDFYGYMLPSLTYTELYHFTQLALNDKYQFPMNVTIGNCRFPHHLKLPKGVTGKGLPVKFVFVVTAYNYRFHKASNLNCDFSSGILALDDFQSGPVFDRDMSESVLMGDNILVKKMNIYHED